MEIRINKYFTTNIKQPIIKTESRVMCSLNKSVRFKYGMKTKRVRDGSGRVFIALLKQEFHSLHDAQNGIYGFVLCTCQTFLCVEQNRL